jgi:hypothetical protein
MTTQHDNTSNTGPASTESNEQPEGGTSGAPESQDGPESHPGSKLHREAAAHRVRAKEAEAQRDALAQRVERMQRAEVERLAADALSHPADLFSLSGNDLADYLTEDGDVDAEKVAADVAAVLAERPGLRKNSPSYDPSQGLGGRPSKSGPSSWADLFKS